MAKARSVYFCSECGGESVRWLGKCPHCGAWNTLVEEKLAPESDAGKPGRVRLNRAQARPIAQISAEAEQRLLTGIAELDLVLGGGLTPGSSVLLGGEPGIGKSTLLLQAAARMTRYGKVLYVSGEESPRQIRLRAERLDCLADDLYLLAATDIAEAVEQARQLQPALVIIDSVQAVFSPELDSAPGSVTQVRAVAAAAIGLARETNAAVMLIGHVTKEGMLAGPRVLEHMVDAVLYFEGDRFNAFRLLRAVKNRFGSTNEVGVFEMGAAGLTSLSSPSAYFLSERGQVRPGSAVCCVVQGTRPLLIEIQALVTPSTLGNPRRLATGFDFNRLLLILAVLERRLGLPLGNKDVYLNIAGGLRLVDPAADLAAAAAIVSSLKDVPIEESVILFGELGLLGELRGVPQSERRLKEAAAFGFAAAVCPNGKAGREDAVRRLTAADLPAALKYLGL
ncbi:MAG: DNA repair protein RadA [Firmicutes bacterium]|nr:DNA repair protein RadA [Bacillota bacterium]